RVPGELAREIAALLESNPGEPMYRLRRTNFFLGKAMRGSGWGRDRLVRLLRKGSARYPERRVHSDIEPPSPAPTLETPLIHETFRSLDQYLEKLERYARWGAEDLRQSRRRARFWQVSLRPIWRFFRAYLLEGGVRDGMRGLIVCGLQSYGV